MHKTKPFIISKHDVQKAWLQVKRNKGSHGVDKETIEMYEVKLKDNLYALWNKMSSGTYFPKEVRRVQIPKGNKGFRTLGIPTVNDRIAQTVVANILNKQIDPTFHNDSYGFRPGKSAHQALDITKTRCIEKSYVIDFDIKGLFDNIPHKHIYAALDAYELEKWVILYIKRWLEVSDSENKQVGTPQGGVISPILANVFMDVCFDKWITKTHPTMKFARYADDCIVHCVSYKQTKYMLKAIEIRLNQCGIKLNKEKTIIATTKCETEYEEVRLSFDFLGYTFKPTKCINNKTKEYFVGCMPIPSTKSRVKINKQIEESRVLKMSQIDIQEIANYLNLRIRGWFNYYGHFNKWAMLPICWLIDNKIAKYIKRKYKNIKSNAKSFETLKKIKLANPKMFYHWECLS